MSSSGGTMSSSIFWPFAPIKRAPGRLFASVWRVTGDRNA